MTAGSFLEQLKQNLNSIAPDMGTEDGMPVTFILQAVATTLANTEMNMAGSTNFLDLTVKTGADLDGFGDFFGIPRWNATPANVMLTFYTETPVKTAFGITPGTRVTDGTHTFQTTQTAVFPVGATSITVPAQSLGTGAVQNVQPYTLTYLAESLANTALNVQNEQSATGGTDAETDEHYRNRIKNTIFHRIIGTAESYENLATTIDDTTRANAIGALSTFPATSELVQLNTAQGGGVGFQSSIANAKYVYPDSSYLIKNPGDSTQIAYVQNVQYNFDTTTVPTDPIFQISSSGLTSALENLSGQSLDQFGSQMGLPRQNGTPTSGRMIIEVPIPTLNSVYVPAGTQFFGGNNITYVTTSDVTIPPETQYSSQVGYVSVGMGNYVLPANSLMQTSNSQLGGLVVTSQTGQEAWTDEQYREQLEDKYAGTEGLNVGDILYSQFDYCSSASRNDPPNVTNCVDVFIDGTNANTVTETGVVNLTTVTTENQQQFVTQSGAYPAIGSNIQILGTGAIENTVSPIMCNGIPYSDTQLLKCYTLLKGSTRAVDAVLFNEASNLPNNGDAYQIQLNVNQAVMDTQSQIEKVRTLGADVLVHAGIKASLILNIVIIPLVGTPANTLISAISTLVSEYLSTLNFGATVSLAKLRAVIEGCQYVETCRFANAQDIGTPTIEGGELNAGIQISTAWGQPMGGTYISDFQLYDDMYPVLGALAIALEGDNTYRQAFSQGGGVSGGSTYTGISNPQIYIAEGGNEN